MPITTSMPATFAASQSWSVVGLGISPDRYRELSTFEHTGDSTIIDPRGEIIAGPAQGETILIAEGSRQAVLAAKAVSDIGGHYSRPDLLRLIVDRGPQPRTAERGIAPDTDMQASEASSPSR
jgi:hypothetical protein